ncbi:F0F1 ATP synthase subunit delta [Gammaproteobacteria bacterium]|nr:F0F1 ATP synthase subunit delta [Gammaproteobacteria bacterium]
MADIKTIARPYAKAAFMSAKEHKNYSDWTGCLNSAQIVMKERSGAELLCSPSISDAQKFLLMSELIALIPVEPGSSKKKTTTFENFIKVLIENKKLRLLPEIYAQFEALRLTEQSIIYAQVYSAFEVTKPQEDSIKTALTKRFKQTVELEISIDPSLIGGAVIKAGDLVIDGSIKCRLEKLNQILSH